MTAIRNLVAVLGLFVVSVSLAWAQPKKLPEANDPYAEQPADPYAGPPAPTTMPPKKDEKAPKGEKPAKVPKTPKEKPGKPADPYADPAIPPAGTPKVPTTLTPNGQQEQAVPADPYALLPVVAPTIPARIGIDDLASVQGLIAVQRLDGWLLVDRDGSNSIASRFVAPTGKPSHVWFVLVPAKGQPSVLAHTTEIRSFDHIGGAKLTYRATSDLQTQLKALVKGNRTLALEYSPKAAVPSASRVDAGTLELVKGAGITVKSSETLAAYSSAIWGEAGRTQHFVAVHHLTELRKDAFARIARIVPANTDQLTEYAVQQEIVKQMKTRGLVFTPPVVASGPNTADPYYVPSANRTRVIKRGDLIVISLAAKVDKPDGVWAAQTWVAFADTAVPPAVQQTFATVKAARDRAIGFIGERIGKGRPITGANVDDAARAVFDKAGVKEQIQHRTGHSIDNDLQGAGADLDNFEVKDKRILTPGTGFTVGPGLYLTGRYGVRSEVSVFLKPTGPEVTTPAQEAVEALLAR